MADHNYGSRNGKTWHCGNCGQEWIPERSTLGGVIVESETFSLGFHYNTARCPKCGQTVLDKGSQQSEIVNP